MPSLVRRLSMAIGLFLVMGAIDEDGAVLAG
jgi:hypothetical protein